MILLDTNVISEQMRLEPSPIVMKWFNEIDQNQLYLSSVTEAELRSGIVMMPNSKAKLLKAEKADSYCEVFSKIAFCLLKAKLQYFTQRCFLTVKTSAAQFQHSTT